MAVFDLFTQLIPDDFEGDVSNPFLRLGIESAIIDEFSQTEAMARLREIGFHFGDRAFRLLWHEVNDFQGQFTYPTRLPFLSLPDPEIMSFSNFPLTAQYGYVGGIPIYDAEHDRLTYRTFRLDSDDLLTRAEALDSLFDLMQRYEDLQDYNVNDIVYIGAMRDSDLWSLEE